MVESIEVAVVLAVNDGNRAVSHNVMHRVADEERDILMLKLLLEPANLATLSKLGVSVCKAQLKSSFAVRRKR